MNIFKIWIKAQLYNCILASNICIIFLIMGLGNYGNKRYQIIESIKAGVGIIIFYTTISVIGGIPLLLAYKSISYLIEKYISNTQIKKIIEMIAYPLSTYSYLILLSYILRINDCLNITFLETTYASTLACISTLISVIVNQHQYKKSTL